MQLAPRSSLHDDWQLSSAVSALSLSNMVHWRTWAQKAKSNVSAQVFCQHPQSRREKVVVHLSNALKGTLKCNCVINSVVRSNDSRSLTQTASWQLKGMQQYL